MCSSPRPLQDLDPTPYSTGSHVINRSCSGKCLPAAILSGITHLAFTSPRIPKASGPTRLRTCAGNNNSAAAAEVNHVTKQDTQLR